MKIILSDKEHLGEGKAKKKFVKARNPESSFLLLFFSVLLESNLLRRLSDLKSAILKPLQSSFLWKINKTFYPISSTVSKWKIFCRLNSTRKYIWVRPSLERRVFPSGKNYYFQVLHNAFSTLLRKKSEPVSMFLILDKRKKEDSFRKQVFKSGQRILFCRTNK